MRRRGDGRWVVPPGCPPATVSANLALRLIQLHLVLIYGMAGLAKLQGQAWWTGMAIWGTLAAGEFSLLDFTWLAAWPYVLNLMTHAALALELGYGVLIWVRVLRPLVIAAAVALHVGIALDAPGLTEFGLAMIAANLAFVSGPWLRSLVAGRDADQPAVRVLYDGACPYCRKSMALLTAADPDHVVEPVDLTAVNVATIHPSLTREACLKAMHVVRRDGRVAAGFDAVALLARWLPLFWPLGADRLACRGSPRWAVASTSAWPTRGRATSPAPTRSAASPRTAATLGDPARPSRGRDGSRARGSECPSRPQSRR